MGLTLGDTKYSFEGDYATKGCYGTNGKNVYYGTGGSVEERKATPTISHHYRPDGYDCYSDGKSQISIWIIIWCKMFNVMHKINI